MLFCLDIDKLKKRAKEATGNIGQMARRKLKVIERDGFKCVVCGSSKCLTIAHIIPVNNGKGRRPAHIKLDNCQTKCLSCHMEEHHPGSITKHTFRFI